MKRFISVFFLLLSLISCAPKYGPRIHYFRKDGSLCYTSKIYGYPNGKRTLVQKDTYKKQNNNPSSNMFDLVKSIVYYNQWPNGEWKLVSKKGFPVYQNGNYCFYTDSLAIPDNIIYSYYDAHYLEQIEVYKDGKRIPYTAGYADGHQTMQYLREKPGVYNWKDGKEYFEREFTEEEWESYRKANEQLNKK